MERQKHLLKPVANESTTGDAKTPGAIFLINRLVLMLILCSLLASCKKETYDPGSPVAEAKKYAIRYKINSFTQEVSTMSSKRGGKLSSHGGPPTSPIHDQIDHLVYIAYNSVGAEVSRRYQPLDPIREIEVELDGIITDSLPAGSYTIVITGAKEMIGINDHYPVDAPWSTGSRPLASSYLSFVYGLEQSVAGGEDVFFKKFNLTVGSEDIEQPVVLERIVGKLEIITEDLIPAGTSSIHLYLPGALLQYGFAEERPRFPQPVAEENTYGIFPIAASDIGRRFEGSVFILNTIEAFDARIICYNSGGDILAERVIEDIRAYKNRKTILRGGLFSGPPAQTFTVSVNDVWDTETEEIDF